MMFSAFLTRRWGATLLTLIFACLTLSACGSDDGGDGTTDTGNYTDTGMDTAADSGGDTSSTDTGADTMGDTVGDTVADTGDDTTSGDTNTADTSNSDATDLGDGGQQEVIEVVGTYTTQFDTTETITEDKWQNAALIDWSNDDNWAVTQNPSDADFNPDKYAKLVWTEPDAEGVFYYCTVDFGLDSAEAARTTDKTADDSNPEEGGCGDFAWTKMTPQGGT